jgi:peptidoglycan/LPS O-acetylase OafA/YrhL
MTRPREGSLPAAVAAFEIPSLDGIRAVSVLIVLLSHVGFGHIVPGGLGVTVFFFLSGYLITTLLVNEHAANGRIHIGHFYVRRFCRLAPPLVITLVLAYGLVLAGALPGGATWEGFFAQLLYFANYYDLFFSGGPNVPAGTGILWSLAVEEHFYIVYPLLLSALLGRMSRRSVGWLLALACVAVLAWRYALTAGGDFSPNRIYYATDTRVDSILYGCLLALLANPIEGQRPKDASPAVAWPLLAAGAGLILVTLVYRDPQFRESLRYTLQGIALMPLFYFSIALRGSVLYQALNWPPLRRLGVYSYAIYLVHHVIVYLLETHVPALRAAPLMLMSALLLSIAFAALVDRYVDPTFRRIRKAYHS